MTTNGEMTTNGLSRRATVLIGALAMAAAAAMSGCSSNATPEKQGGPVTTTVNPMGPNSYTPTVIAPGPQTALPGNVNTGS